MFCFFLLLHPQTLKANTDFEERVEAYRDSLVLNDAGISGAIVRALRDLPVDYEVIKSYLIGLQESSVADFRITSLMRILYYIVPY